MEESKIEIVLDVETTGLNKDEDRIIEIGCIRLVDYVATDNFHEYINPGCSIPKEASAIHGIYDDKVKDKPSFADIAQKFLDFIGNYDIVAHNGNFDLGFLNEELYRAGFEKIAHDRLIDSLTLARKKFPGQKNRLDDLCLRYNIDTSARTFHGALLDAELLSKVYIELCGIKQKSFNFLNNEAIKSENIEEIKKQLRERAPKVVTKDQIEKHKKFVMENLSDNSLWKKIYV